MIELFIYLALIMAAALIMLLAPLVRSKGIPRTARQRFIAVVSIGFFALGFAVYAYVGAPQLIGLIKKRDHRVEELKAEITANMDMVKKDPKSLGAWVTLGTDFLETGQIDSAVLAFKQAVLISGGDPVLVLAYAKAQVLQADGKVTDDAKRGFDIVLMLQPQNPDARYYLALRKLQEGKTQEAMKDMKALYKSLPDGAPVKDMINHQIGRAPAGDQNL